MEAATSSETPEIVGLNSETVTLAKRYHELRGAKEELEAKMADIDAERDQIGDLLKAKMEELGLQKFNLKGLGTYYLQATFAPKVIGDPAAVIQWLDTQGKGEVAPRTINKPAFKELYKESVEKDLPLPPPELVEAYTEVGVRLRRAKV